MPIGKGGTKSILSSEKNNPNFLNETGLVMIKRVCSNCKYFDSKQNYCHRSNTREPKYGYCGFHIPNPRATYRTIKNYKLEKII